MMAPVKTLIDKGGRCNASQSYVMMMATHSQTRVNSDYVLNFHNDVYTTITIFACFWYTKRRLMQKPSIGNAII